jgi:hypothetical protein
MFKDREKLNQAYHTMLTMTLTWALVLAINQYYQLRVPIVLGAIYSFAPALLIYLFDINRKNVVSYLVLGSILPILALFFWLRELNPLIWIQDLVNWCVSYNGAEELYVKNYARFIVFSVALLGAVLFFLVTKRQIDKIILAIILIATLITLSINKVGINKAVVAICIFYILTIIIEIYGILYSRKAGKQEKREGILYLAPVCLLLAILSITLPSKEEPIQWKGVKHIYNNVIDQIEGWKSDLHYLFSENANEFTVNLTGYSEDGGKLSEGNNLIKDSKVALKISASQRNKPIYLIGSVSDVYTGDSWEKSKKENMPEENEYSLDYAELVYALSRQTPEVLQNNRFIERITLEVDYNNIKTKTFFYPIKMSWYEMFSKKVEISTVPANITFSKLQGRGTSYQSIFYEMNLQGEAFQKILRESDSFSYESASSINLDSARWLQENELLHDNAGSFLARWNFYELLGERAELINSRFTGLPDALPERVMKLSEEITADYETKYDKLKAIENYLRQYKYNLDMEQVPKGKDFTDYFLFESKEGYCTAYATAMAVLGRCIGIPTRYVEGFVARFQFKEDDNMFPVRNSQAHAWAEAYIEGIGWIPFEATSPFYEARYTKWAELTKAEDSTGLGYPNPNEQPNHYEGEIDPTLLDAIEIEEEYKPEGLVNGVIIILASLVLLIVVVTIYYFVLKYHYNKVFDTADYSKKMYMLLLRILKLLKREGFVLDQNETILMLSMRVKDHFHYDRITFQEVANIFMRYRYAETEVTKKEYEEVAVYHKGLSIKQRQEDHRVKVWMEEFIFLVRRSNR